MWNLISTHSLTQQRIHLKNYQKHLSNLSRMKSMIHIRQPKRPEFVYSKPKLQMTRRDKLLEIDKQNEILYHKMQGIKLAKYTNNKLRSESQQLKTLNTHFMNQQAKKHQYQNRKICNAILKIESLYTTAFSTDRIQTLEKFKYNISAISKKTMSSQELNSRASSPYRSRKIKSKSKTHLSKQTTPLFFKSTTESDLLTKRRSQSQKMKYRPFSTEVHRSTKKLIQNQQNTRIDQK